MKLRDSGEHDAVKHREALWQRWHAELMRESGNLGALTSAESRALHDPGVRLDPELQGMIAAFAASCRADLQRGPERGVPVEAGSRGEVEPPAGASDEPPRSVVERLEHEFHYHIRHFNEVEARRVLERMREPQRAAHVEKLGRLTLRRGRYERLIALLTERALDASSRGDAAKASRALRKLSSIHSAHPQILGDARFAKIRAEIIGAADERDHEETARQLVAKERAVAEEIRHLAAAVHRFHKVARAMPHDREEYLRAEQAYHKIAGAVTSHDEEWMAGLILELADLLSEWDEPPAGAQHQVDKFLASVRSALAHIKLEMKQIERGE